MTTKLHVPVHPLAIRVGLVAEAPAPYPKQIRSALDVFDLLGDLAKTWDRERFLTLALDGGHRVLGIEEVSVGCLNSAPVSPREVFKGLILVNALAFIAVHNHPTGDPTPSEPDRAVTRVLAAAGDVLGIRLLDHIVLGHDRYTSLKDEGGPPFC